MARKCPRCGEDFDGDGAIRYGTLFRSGVTYCSERCRDEAEASELTTQIEYGVSTPTAKIEELGYSTVGRKFVGWKVFRDYDNTWYVIDANGKAYWSNSVPEGGSYKLYRNGAESAKTAPAGTSTHFYAQWETIG